jgi:amino acid permease
MFIIIPLILIFFCVAYLFINDDLSIVTQGFIYFLIFGILFISFYLFKIIKSDMEKQELNQIQIEINRLAKKLEIITDETQRKGISNEINRLKKDYDELVN